jgi:tol-pal system protein YbgF
VKTYNMKLLLAAFLLLANIAGAQAQAPVVRVSPADISQRLARIEQQLQNQGLLNMLQQLESIQAELSQIRGELEVQRRDIEELNKRQRALYTDLDQRLQGLGQTPATDLTTMTGPGATGSPPLQTLSPTYEASNQVTAPSVESTLNIQMLPATPATQLSPDITNDSQTVMAPEPQSIAPQTEVGADPASPAPLTGGPEPALAEGVEAGADLAQMQVEYDRAFNLLKSSQYEMAIQELTVFLSKYPDGNFSDNAQYWLGEANYVTRQFEQALQEYNKLVVNFPHSQKYTHALLKIGYCYHELGRIDEARKYLQALTRQYPGETASRLAEERLKSIALTEQQNPVPQN